MIYFSIVRCLKFRLIAKKLMLGPDLKSRYSIEKILSENSIKTEVLLVSIDSDQRVVAHIFNLDSLQDTIITEIRKTVQDLSDASLEGFLPIVEIVWDYQSSKLFVLQSIDKLVPLSAFVDTFKKNNEEIPEDCIWTVIFHVCQAIKTLSHHRMALGAHMGISTTNIFVTGVSDISNASSEFSVFLGLPCLDQALHPCMLSGDIFQKSMCAPELFDSFIPDVLSDVYSLGIITYTLVMLHKPFSLQTVENLLHSMKVREYAPISGVSTELSALIEDLLNPQVDERPSLDRLLSLPQVKAQRTKHETFAIPQEQQARSKTDEDTSDPRSQSPRQTDLSPEPDKDGNTTLMRHVKRNNWYIAKRFVEEQARSYNNEGVTALMLAARLGFTNIVQKLIPYEAGMQSVSPNFEGYTAMMFAAQRDNPECVKLLIDTESGLMNKVGRTALMLAAANDHLRCVDLLLAREGGLQDNEGWSSLMNAVITRRLDVIDKLGEREHELKTKNNNTALDLVNNFVIEEERDAIRDRVGIFETNP